MTLDTELLFNEHGFCSYDTLMAKPCINRHTQSLLETVASLKYADMFQMLDSMRVFEFSSTNFYIYKPCALNAVIYDCKVHNGSVFFAVFYALDNHIAKVCQSNGFEYVPDKNLWYKLAPIDEQVELQALTSQMLRPFLSDVTAFCHLAINKANMVISYNNKLFI